MFRQTNRSSRRFCGGYSLLELMIVLAILVAIMAIAWPNISRRLQLIGPREAALQLKADLAEARERSVLSGEAWVLRIERGGANYEIGPVAEFREDVLNGGFATMPGLGLETDPFSSADVASSNVEVDPSLDSVIDTSRIRKNELPTGMVFDDGFAHTASETNAIRDATIQPALAVDVRNLPTITPPSDNWKFAVIFQPDGRATESEVRLKETATENKILLRVRRFTGGVTIDKLERKSRDATEMVDPLGSDSERFEQPQGSPRFPTGAASQPLDVEGVR